MASRGRRLRQEDNLAGKIKANLDVGKAPILPTGIGSAGLPVPVSPSRNIGDDAYTKEEIARVNRSRMLSGSPPLAGDQAPERISGPRHPKFGQRPAASKKVVAPPHKPGPGRRP